MENASLYKLLSHRVPTGKVGRSGGWEQSFLESFPCGLFSSNKFLNTQCPLALLPGAASVPFLLVTVLLVSLSVL